MHYDLWIRRATVVTGNCGLSLAPSSPNGRIPAPLDLIATPEWLRFPAFRDFLSEIAADLGCTRKKRPRA